MRSEVQVIGRKHMYMNPYMYCWEELRVETLTLCSSVYMHTRICLQ